MDALGCVASDCCVHAGDGTGEVIGLGEPLPENWATHRINHHTLYAMWQAAKGLGRGPIDGNFLP